MSPQHVTYLLPGAVGSLRGKSKSAADSPKCMKNTISVLQFILRGTSASFVLTWDVEESDKPLRMLSLSVPGATLRVIRNNNSVEVNLNDMNSFPLDLNHTNPLERKQLYPR